MDTIKQNNILNTKNNVVLPWIKYLENIRGYGVHTLDAYKRDVVEFLIFCTDRNPVSYTHLTLPTKRIV